MIPVTIVAGVDIDLKREEEEEEEDRSPRHDSVEC